ncbi:AraC family transcriptional regulator [Sinorhizobium sp. BG8]|uniref:AraC-like transcriptional regulator QhpR n=1 Tax=Sinorhizobium sp. BG8 TaxID=2613773 RepID=UPI00193DFCBA|nr:AraC family transcriptional regulator [Sinorhizobium sp. BG8]QRM57444.1 AraC family transcriptional regulator [Sinorhizobium sp. BG8]
MEHARQSGRIDRRILAGVGAELLARGVDPDLIAQKTGSGEDPASAGAGTVGLAEFVGFLQRAGTTMPDPAAVWRCGRAYVPTGLPELFPGFRRGTRLHQVLAGVVDAMNELQSASLIRLRVSDALALIEYRILDPAIWPRAFDVEFTFGFFDGVIRDFFLPDFRPDSIVFEHEADRRRGVLDASFGLTCIYGFPSNILAFPAALLSMPALHDRPARAAGSFVTVPDDSADGGLATRLRQAVLMRIGEGPMDQTAIAAMVGLSTRTLRRRLLAEGLCFRDEIERLRMEYASEMILRTNLPLMELACRLGYSQQSDFTRAFRRFAGIPPSAFRNGRGTHS